MSVIGELEFLLTADASSLTGSLKTAGLAVSNFSKVLSDSSINLQSISIASGLAGAAILGTAAIIGTTAMNAARDWQQELVTTGNNAGMSATQITEMGKAVLNLSAQTGASKDQLLQAYMYIHDMGYAGQQAAELLDEAAKEALATGSSVADTASTLATVMHEFGTPISEAASTMDMLHTAAASARMTMQDMVSVFGPVGAQASAMNLPLDQTAAAFAALTRNGFDAALSATQVRDMLVHMMSPTAASKKALESLSTTTGIDLVGDFSAAGIQTKGFTGILDDLSRATHGNADEMNKLIPNLRGGLGATVLVGKGHQDFVNILNAENKSLGSTESAYAQYSKTTVAAQQRINQEMNNLQIAVGNALLPALDKLLTVVTPIIAAVANWAEKNPTLVVAILASVAALGALLLAVSAVAAIITLGMPAAIAVGIAALIGFASAILLNFDKIKTFVTDHLQAIGTALLTLFGGPMGILVGLVVNNLNSIKSAWQEFKNFINNTIQGIIGYFDNLSKKAESALSYLNPFAKHSPSLVDQVTAGVAQIKSTYESLGKMSIPAPSLSPSSFISGGQQGLAYSQNYNSTTSSKVNNITMTNSFNVQGQANANNLAEHLGFQLEHLGLV